MDEALRRLQLTQLEILKVVDRFCREHDIKYSLYAGTLLGAVRHKGFIPWDDDLDICMLREHYDKFIELWNTKRPKGYILQNKDNTPGFTQSFTKIRKEHTTFLQLVDLPDKYHVGIFIDVFPCDRIPHEPIKKRLYQMECILYQLYTKEYIPSGANRLEKLLLEIVLKSVLTRDHEMMRHFLLKRLQRYNNDKRLEIVFNETVSTIRTLLPHDLMKEYIDIQFEDGQYMSMKNWDTYLSMKFGDYMTPPPESERVSIHNAQIIDYNHDYYELQKYNKMGS